MVARSSNPRGVRLDWWPQSKEPRMPCGQNIETVSRFAEEVFNKKNV
jgi:hypothetical protein